MSPHVDILAERESLRKPLLGSLGLHAGLFALVAATAMVKGPARVAWGDLSGGGPGSMTVNVVNKIPLPSRSGIVNPLASDTESQVPMPPPKPKAQERAKPSEPDAIPLKSRAAQKRAAEAASSTRFRARADRPNQAYSTTGQALVSPMIGQTGSGGVGVGTGSSPFGNRYGWYVDILKQKVAHAWRTGDIDPRIKTAPVVIITFTILRSGEVRNVRVAQRSGNAALDYSAERAIYDAAPFPQLPGDFERNEATIEFWFELRR